MLLVAKKRSRIAGVPKVIAIITFHVHRDPAQVAAVDESSHASGCVAELIIMAYRQLEPFLIGEYYKDLGLFGVERDGFLHIDVASPFQASPRNNELAGRRPRDMNNIWLGRTTNP